MIGIYEACGTFGPPLSLLTLVVFGLSIHSAFRVLRSRSPESHAASPRIHAILLWGAVAALVGVLGTCSGLYNAAEAISVAQEISIQVTAGGFAEGLLATLWGLSILLYAGVIWLLLRAWESRTR